MAPVARHLPVTGKATRQCRQETAMQHEDVLPASLEPAYSPAWSCPPVPAGAFRAATGAGTAAPVGVILAAGIGSRLRPMTNHKPKCLVQSAGKALLQYQIDAYVEAGVGEIVILVGYESAAIVDYCKHIRGVSIRIVENAEYETTNNMYSLHLVREHLRGRSFVLNNADLAVDRSVVRRLLEVPGENAVAVDTSVYIDESMKVAVGEDGRIRDISKAIRPESAHGCSIDFYKFSAAAGEVLFDEIARIIEVEGSVREWTEVAMQRLFQAGRLDFRACDIAGLEWVEVDNYEDLALADRTFSGFDAVLDEIDTFVFDLDGTVYVGDRPVEGAARVIGHLQELGKSVYFASNNSSASSADYVARLAAMGIRVGASQIILSSDAMVAWLHRHGVRRIHVLGTRSFRARLAAEGFEVGAADPEYVVVGYDTELDYAKLVAACRLINRGVDILATHMDTFCPTEAGPIPDIGAMLEMIRATTGRVPKKVFGKPDESMILLLQDRTGADPRRTLVVGDRLHTDIAMARAAGVRSLLVLSGETSRDQLDGCQQLPDHVLRSIHDIVRC
jgi:HAD superfamily hydrolase (TIGR01450 family)